MSPRNLDFPIGENRLQRLLDGLLEVKADDVIGLVLRCD